MLDCMVEKPRQQEISSREDTPTERRALGAFLYHAGLSYRRMEPFVEQSYEAIRQWFHRLKHLFELDYRERQKVAVDETKIEVDGEDILRLGSSRL
jgi:putative transposase